MKTIISVLIPVFNEEDSVAKLHSELLPVLRETGYDFEIIFIDDGSTDNTLFELKKLKPVRVISFSRNFGKSQALQAGFDVASGDYVFTMDGDLQDDPKEIPNFLLEIERSGSDLIVGWKKDRKDLSSKKISSKIANSITSILTGAKVHDMNCCFKIYKKELVKNLKLYGDMHRYIPAMASILGFKVNEMVVHHRVRVYGKSKYGKFGLRRIFKSFFDLITIVLMRRFKDRPMHFFGMLGLWVSFFGMVILAYLGWVRIVIGENIGDRPLLFLGILLMLIGFQSFSLGFVGDLVKGSSNEKNFIIKERVDNN